MTADRDAFRTIRGRGATANPPNRFVALRVIPDDEQRVEDDPAPQTVFLRDTSRSVIARNDSPDIPFELSLNPYRGCEHGCIYCYARPTHEYLGFSAGLDFETRIMVKADAPLLLRQALSGASWKPAPVAIGGVTDPYQPVERRLRLTRRCLEVFWEFRNPVSLVTKNHLITRDIDLLGEMARFNLAAVHVSITTLDAELARIMEPRTASPRLRLETIQKLAKAGVPVCALVAPVIPGLTDHEMPAIVAAAASAGATSAGYQPLRLPLCVADLFTQWLERHLPDRKEKVLNRIRSMREGKLNNAEFGLRMTGRGVFAEQIGRMFEVAARKAGLNRREIRLATEHFRRPGKQMELFE